MLLPLVAIGQDITGLVTDIDGIPLIGANVTWQDGKIGTVTDENGHFTIKELEGSKLIFSFVGYKSETINVGDLKHWKIMLIEDNTLTEVQISTKSNATRFADQAAKVEVIGIREIERAACCSLAGCFSTNSNVTAATTNIITNAKELQILGLAGVYNQILFDDLPLISGTAFQYGTGSYPGTLIKNIFVAKGSNSVLQGGQSISGQINIIPHDAADSDRLYLNAFVNSFGESQYNINHAFKKEKWNNFTALHLTSPAGLRDKDGDGFRDVVRTNRFSIYNKLKYQDPANEDFSMQLALRFWKEKREGGTMAFDAEKHLGSSTIYGQHVDLIHGDASAKFNYSLTDDLSLTFQSSLFRNDQENFYGIKRYVSSQLNVTNNLFMDYFYGSNDNNLKFGLSYINNQLTEEISLVQESDLFTYEGIYNQDYSLPGIYTEHTLYFNDLTLITGIRADHYEEIGLKFVPRLLVRYELNESADIRFSIGKGIRIAHPFAERINLLSGNRNIIFSEDLVPEEAINSGLSYVHSFFLEQVDITLSGDFYYTIFQNQIFPDYDREISTAFISNFTGNSISKSVNLESKFTIKEQYDLKLAYNFLDIYQERKSGIDQTSEKVYLPFIPKHKLLINNSFTTNDDAWQFDLTYKWFSKQSLPNTENYPEQYQREDFSQAYSNINMQITKRWPRFEIYSGIENLLDFRQEFPILASDDPFGKYFDPAFAWGPTKGREFYLGLRMKFADK